MTSPWWKPSPPDTVHDTPWLHPAVIAYLESLLRPGYTVIEHGSGGSTMWIYERVVELFSVESNRKWYETMHIKTEHLESEYFHLYFEPFGLIPYGLPLADLLLIDGEPLDTRRAWLNAAPSIVKRGGIVVLDNANRPEYYGERLELAEKAKQVITFDMNARNTRYLVTQFFLMSGGEREWI